MDFPSFSFKVSFSPKALAYFFFNKALQNHGNGIDLCLQAANDFLGEHPGNGSTLVHMPLGELIHWKSIT